MSDYTLPPTHDLRYPFLREDSGGDYAKYNNIPYIWPFGGYEHSYPYDTMPMPPSTAPPFTLPPQNMAPPIVSTSLVAHTLYDLRIVWHDAESAYLQCEYAMAMLGGDDVRRVLLVPIAEVGLVDGSLADLTFRAQDRTYWFTRPEESYRYQYEMDREGGEPINLALLLYSLRDAWAQQ